MNEIATKVYELLMSGPEWFDMSSHKTCIYEALQRVAPIEDYYSTLEAYEALGISYDDCWTLCMTDRVLIDWDITGATGARLAASALKAACEANHDSQ